MADRHEQNRRGGSHNQKSLQMEQEFSSFRSGARQACGNEEMGEAQQKTSFPLLLQVQGYAEEERDHLHYLDRHCFGVLRNRHRLVRSIESWQSYVRRKLLPEQCCCRSYRTTHIDGMRVFVAIRKKEITNDNPLQCRSADPYGHGF